MSKENTNMSIIKQNINALAGLYKKGEFINALSFGKSLIKRNFLNTDRIPIIFGALKPQNFSLQKRIMFW